MAFTMEINPFEFFADTNGDALDAGYIWIGEVNKDPRLYPVTIYYDQAQTIPAMQPLRTSNGYVVRNGSPTFLYVTGNYSVMVLDKRGRQVYYVPDFLLIGNSGAVSIPDLSNTTDPGKGDAYIGVKRISPPGGVGTTLHNWIEGQFINVKTDFGAVGDGVTDDTLAFQNACASTRDVFVPAGNYRITQTINKPSGVIFGEGYQSALIFENMGGNDGIQFTPSTNQTTSGAKDLAIYAKGTDAGIALKTPYDVNQYVVYRSSFQFSGLLISGYTRATPGTNNAFETIETWQCGIQQGDAWNVGIDECDGYGSYRSDTDPTNQTKSCFIRLDAENAMLTSHISHLTCSNYYRGIEIGRRCFFQIHYFDIAHSYDGIYQTSASPDSFGESKLTHGNINAQHFGVYFQDIGTREISGVVVRRHRFGWKGAAYDWAGIRLVNCTYIWVTDCQIAPDESGGAFSGVHYGAQLVQCGGVAFNGFTVNPGLDRAILMDNCTMITSDNLRTFQNESTDVIFRAINNTRSSILSSYVKVSTFSGTEYSDDGSISAGAIQQYQRNIIPEGGSPQYIWRRSSSALNEKIWRTVSGATTWALQMSTDDESTNSNAIIATRSATTMTSLDIRTARVVLSNGPTINVGSASPEGSVTASPGSIYMRTTGGASTSFYVKESGTGNTGWVGK